MKYAHRAGDPVKGARQTQTWPVRTNHLLTAMVKGSPTPVAHGVGNWNAETDLAENKGVCISKSAKSYSGFRIEIQVFAYVSVEGRFLGSGRTIRPERAKMSKLRTRVSAIVGEPLAIHEPGLSASQPAKRVTAQVFLLLQELQRKFDLKYVCRLLAVDCQLPPRYNPRTEIFPVSMRNVMQSGIPHSCGGGILDGYYSRSYA
ncbi:MAG TPA: hypothetical protein VE263_11095 [Candidatus Angelobacter sp.]|nr:hypothetical protein [Candidatus Angelobacter sp.]